VLATNIKQLIKNVFNKDVFSFYDGIVEKVDISDRTLDVRIPVLGNSLYEDCKIVIPCSTNRAVIYPNYKINSHVIIGFLGFNLGQPVILGSIADNTIPKVEKDTISIINDKCKILVNTSAITITNGTSTIIINEDGIKFTGPAITANGEDLTVDDEGAI
jgi:hypothetical protein